jgi:hypothetical protein
MIGIDGSSLRRIGGQAPGAVYAIVSPKGDRVTFVSNSARFVFTTPLPAVAGVSPTELNGTGVRQILECDRLVPGRRSPAP